MKTSYMLRIKDSLDEFDGLWGRDVHGLVLADSDPFCLSSVDAIDAQIVVVCLVVEPCHLYHDLHRLLFLALLTGHPSDRNFALNPADNEVVPVEQVVQIPDVVGVLFALDFDVEYFLLEVYVFFHESHF